MNAVAGLLLLITGEAAPALATIAKVQGGLAGLSGSVAEANAGGFLGGLAKIGVGVGAAVAIATAAVVGFGLESAHALVDSGEEAYKMSQKFGIAKSVASEWIAAGTAVGVSAGEVSHAFQFLGRNMETLNLHMHANPEDSRKVMESTEALRLSTERYNIALRQHGANSMQAQSALLALQRTQDSYNKVTGETAAKMGPSAQAFHDMGINIFDAQGKLVPMTEIMLKVADVFKAMPDGAEKTGLAMRLFGRSGANLIPLLDEGADGIRAFMAQAKALGATLSDQQVEAAHKAFLAQQQLTLAWQGATSQLGAYFLPVLINVVNFMAKTAIPNLERLGHWLSPFIAQAIAWVGQEFLKAWPYLQRFGQALVDAWPSVVRIGKSLGDDLGPAIQKLLPILGPIADFLTKQIAPGFKLLADNMAIVKPILIALIGYFLAFKAVMFVDTLLKFGQAFLAMAEFEGVAAAASTALGISELVALWPLLLIALAIAGVIVIGYLLITHWKQLSTTVTALGQLLWKFMVIIWKDISTAVGGFFSHVGSTVQSGLKKVGDFFSAFGTKVHQIWNQIVKTVEAAAHDFYMRPWYWITRLVLFIPAMLIALILKVGEWAAQFREWGQKAATGFFNAIGGWLQKLPGAVWQYLSDAYHGIVKWGQETIASGQKTGQQTWDAIVKWFRALPGELQKWWDATITSAGQWIIDMVKQANDMVTRFKDTITQFDWGKLGGDILRGIVEGMKNLGGWLWNEMGKIGKQIQQGIQDSLGIGSPSRVMAEQVGKPIAQGIALGIRQNAHLAQGALGNLTAGLAGGTSGGGGAGGGGLHIGSMTVNNPQSEVDLISALQRQEYLARMKERGIAPALRTAPA